MELQIKSLERQLFPVTIPRNASVMDLKREIKTTMNIDSQRQRLIFQGRVLKDDKHLADYPNLDNGKVVHLVTRPADVPHNPINDDPNLRNRSQTGPTNHLLRAYIGFPPVQRQRLLYETFYRLSRNNRPVFFTNQQHIFPLPPITLNSPSSDIPQPASVEERLAQMINTIQNTRRTINSNDLFRSALMPPPQNEETSRQLRERYRDVASILSELYTLTPEIISRLDRLATDLEQSSSNASDTMLSRFRNARMIQLLGVVNCLLSSLLGSTNGISRSPPVTRHEAPSLNQLQDLPPPTVHPSLVRLPSHLHATENPETTHAPSATPTNTTNKRSPLSSSSSSTNSSKKRKLSGKELKNKKGKKKDKQG